MRTCTKCGEEKPFTDFHRRKNGTYNSWCRPCQVAASQAWEARNPDRRLKVRLAQHGLTMERYVELLEAQDGRCAICGTDDPSPGSWRIDHDHTCCPGKFSCGQCVRGLLCNFCNVGLGSFRDDPAALAAAIAYLKREG